MWRASRRSSAEELAGPKPGVPSRSLEDAGLGCRGVLSPSPAAPASLAALIMNTANSYCIVGSFVFLTLARYMSKVFLVLRRDAFMPTASLN